MNQDKNHMEGEWKNLVYISVLGKHQTKSDIARAWDISINGGPLYQEKVKKDIEEMVDNNLIEKRGSTLYADFRSEEFEKRLKEHIETVKENNEENSSLETHILNNFEEFLDFVRNEDIRREIFDIETMVEVCDGETSVGKSMKMFKPFDILFNSYSKIFVPRFIDKMRNQNRKLSAIMDGFETMFESYATNLIEDSKYNVRPFIDNLEEYEDKHGRIDYLMDCYSQSASSNFPFSLDM